MILYQYTPWRSKEGSPFHIIKRKKWSSDNPMHQLISLDIFSYCGKKFQTGGLSNRRHKFVTVDKEERKKYKKLICKTCKEKIISQTTT